MDTNPRDEVWQELLEQRCIDLEDQREVFERAARELERTLGYDLDVLGFSSLDEFDASTLIDSIREYEQERAQQRGGASPT